MANILVFGDSIAHGDYDSEGGWVDRLKRHLKVLFLKGKISEDIDLYNLCVDGDTSKEVLERLEYECAARCWDKKINSIVFAIGINDSIIINDKNKTPKAKFKNNLEKLYSIASKYANIIIFVGLTPVEETKVTPMPWSPEESWLLKEIKKYDGIIQNFCKENDLPYLYLYDKLTIKDLADGAHPNTKGHEIIFQTVKNFLEEKKYI